VRETNLWRQFEGLVVILVLSALRLFLVNKNQPRSPSLTKQTVL
jgi:hypothetical protein